MAPNVAHIRLRLLSGSSGTAPLFAGKIAPIRSEVAVEARVADHHGTQEDHQLALARGVVAIAHHVAQDRDAREQRQAAAVALELVLHQAAEYRDIAAGNAQHALEL